MPAHHDQPVSQQRWSTLEQQIRQWWNEDLHVAREEEIRNDQSRTLLFLPHTYSSAGGSERVFPEMYAWDTYFINLGLLIHGRTDLVCNHILNYLHMIERYGFMPNGNRTFYLTRSQTPVLALSVLDLYKVTGERDLLYQAYPLLKKQYNEYWNGPHHRTPVGLSTNRDLGDPGLPPELAAEAETGLDFTALFEGDVRRWTPLITNCALVQYARTLATIAEEIGASEEAQRWQQDAQQRSQRIRELCWNEQEGFFFDYNHSEQRQGTCWSLCAYWTLWAGIASKEQAQRLVEHLGKFEQPHGLSFTDSFYPSPHPQFQWLQWGFPAGWAPMHIITVAGLDAYGYTEEAKRVATPFLNTMVTSYEQTGYLYEKYNVAEGGFQLPKERSVDTPPLHGWTSAAAVILGHRLFAQK